MRTRFLALAAVTLMACDDPPPAPAPPSADSAGAMKEPANQPAAVDSGRRPKMRNKGRMRAPRGGPSVVIRTALKSLDLDDAQKEKLQGIGKAAKPEKAAEKELLEALAAGMRAGKMDDALVDAKLAELKKQMAGRRDRSHEALNTLHATLTPEQRTKLVEQMQQGGGGREPADWLEYGNNPGKLSMRSKQKSNVLSSINALKITRGLSLTTEQRQKVRELTRGGDRKDKLKKPADPDARRARIKAVTDAFVTDSFDAKKLAGDGGLTEEMSKAMDYKVDLVRALMEVLDEEQRKKAADNLERTRRRTRRTRGPRSPKARGVAD